MMRRKLLILLSLLIISAEVWSMGLFDFMKVCLFSEVNGVVTLKGVPIEGAEVIRSATMDDKVQSDKTVTDKNGKFHFNAMYSSSIKKILPVEPVVQQKLELHYKGVAYLGWRLFKHNFDLNGELDDDAKISLGCELTEESTSKSQKFRGPVVGVCKWK